jgi:hypothetical protein
MRIKCCFFTPFKFLPTFKVRIEFIVPKMLDGFGKLFQNRFLFEFNMNDRTLRKWKRHRFEGI